MALKKDSILADGSGNELPSPVSMSIGDEIIWSGNTGRVASGKMNGTPIVEKKTTNITWGCMTKEEIETLEKKFPKGYVTCYILGEKYEIYRGTLTKEVMGYIGDGKLWYRSASVDIVER